MREDKTKKQKRSKRQNGTGCFSIKSNGKYMLRLNYGFRENGTPRILTVSGRTQKECNKLMAAKKAEIDEKENTIGEFWGTLTLGELCLRHFMSKLEKKDTLKPKSADREESTINNQIGIYPIGSLQVDTITSKDIEKHYESLFKRYAPSTVQKVFVKINEAYNWAIFDDHLTNNPCTRTGEPVYVAQEGTSKTDIPRIIELSAEAEKWLTKVWEYSKYKNPDDYIVLNRNHKPTEAGSFGETLNTIYRNAELPQKISGCHVLRRTYATRLYMAGYKDSMIATYIGDTLETLLKYYVCNCKVVEVGTKTLNVIPLPKEEKSV